MTLIVALVCEAQLSVITINQKFNECNTRFRKRPQQVTNVSSLAATATPPLWSFSWPWLLSSPRAGTRFHVLPRGMKAVHVSVASKITYPSPRRMRAMNDKVLGDHYKSVPAPRRPPASARNCNHLPPRTPARSAQRSTQPCPLTSTGSAATRRVHGRYDDAFRSMATASPVSRRQGRGQREHRRTSSYRGMPSASTRTYGS